MFAFSGSKFLFYSVSESSPVKWAVSRRRVNCNSNNSLLKRLEVPPLRAILESNLENEQSSPPNCWSSTK